LGKWYEIEKSQNIFQNGRCTEANYGPVSMGQVAVLNKELGGNKVSAVQGYATQPTPNNGGLKVFLRVPIGKLSGAEHIE